MKMLLYPTYSLQHITTQEKDVFPLVDACILKDRVSSRQISRTALRLVATCCRPKIYQFYNTVAPRRSQLILCAEHRDVQNRANSEA